MGDGRTKWTDERLDDLVDRIDESTRLLRQEIAGLRSDMTAGFQGVHQRLDSLEGRLNSFMVAMIAGLFALLAALASTIVAVSV